MSGRDEWTPERLEGLARFWSAKLVMESTALGVFGVLARGPATSGELAARLETDERATELLLNALTGLDLLQKHGDRYRNADASARYLVPASDEYLGHMLVAANDTWELWGELDEALRTGQAQRPDFIFADDPEGARALLLSIHDRAIPHIEAMLEREMIDPSRYGTMLDLGGGAGTYSVAFCETNPHLRATLIDLAPAVALARDRIRAAALGDRVRVIEADFETAEIPGTYDLVWVSNLIHGRGPEANRDLIRRLSRRLRPDGELAIHDIVLDEDRTRPARGAVFSVHMLLNTGDGRCYTFEEIRGWLDAAGLRAVRRTERHDDHEIVFGRRGARR